MPKPKSAEYIRKGRRRKYLGLGKMIVKWCIGIMQYKGEVVINN